MQARRVLSFLIACVAMPLIATRSADAEPTRVAVMTDAEPLQAALRVTLAGRGAEVALIGGPLGELRLERAAAAQQGVQASGSHAGVWIDQDETGSLEVYVVSADGRFLRHAPLPDASPRIFAAIATSLLDELFVPTGVPIDVDVHVDVGPPPALPTTPLVASTAPAVASAAELATTETVPAIDPNWHRPRVELGTSLSPASVGIATAVLLPITPRLRIGVAAGVNVLTDGVADMMQGTKLYLAAVEARIIGRSRPSHRHIEAGLLVGAAYADDLDEGGFAAGRVSVVFEGARSNIALSVMPAVLVGFRGADAYVPSILVGLSVELPL